MAHRRIEVMAIIFVFVLSPSGLAHASSPAFQTEVPVWDYQIVAQYPHDDDAYTQGLVIVEGELYEGTGLKGQSSLRRVDLRTGDVLKRTELSDEYFGEGIAVVGDRIYQLTWQEETCFVYDRESFDPLGSFHYTTEGWGLTLDDNNLIMSDGTNRITYRDPTTFEEIRHIDVFDGEVPINSLNELEFIDGEIWANVYMTDYVARIDPKTGRVTGWIDFTGLLSQQERDLYQVDVLNGIAQDPESGNIYVTGKLWPTLLEVEVVPEK